MKITTDHAASSYGIPVILGDDGQPLDYGPGIKAALAVLGWDKRRLAEETGFSVRTVEGWLAGRMPEVSALNVLAGALAGLEWPAKESK